MPIALILTEKDLNRLWEKVVKGSDEDACWTWADALSQDGYAYIHIGGRRGRKYLVHRLLYELKNPILEGLDLDHLCRNRFCVRPEHQEPVSRRVNLLRGKTLAACEAGKTHCPSGHSYDLFNTRFYKGWRICRKCGILGRARRTKERVEKEQYESNR